VEVKQQYQIKISNRFAGLGNLEEEEDVNISKAWKVLERIQKLKLQRD
jgi:hypothetical protein